jgi:murein DD-endopeptidase MepM/ murein hydrolase activator NlpD
MMTRNTQLRATLTGASLLVLAGCVGDGGLGDLDWDLRGGAPGAFDTTDAARQVTGNRPAPDARGIITYPTYQVAVGQRGDTVGSIAQRIGVDAASLASFNGLQPNTPINQGEVLALPTRVGGTAIAAAPGAAATGVDVTSIATTALDRVGPSATTPPPAAAGPEPARHQVKRGETAFSIARTYNVSAKALAEWNGLGPDLAVREGQFLMIPTAVAGAAPPPGTPVAVTTPGSGTPTPLPPSAAQPLPDEETPPAGQVESGTVPGTPESPDLGDDRTAASASQMTLPAQGSIIRGYAKGRNEGIDIGAPAGSAVVAAADGTIAAITKDTQQVPIIVIRHADGLLTVYAGVDGITVAKGDRVQRGQKIAVVRAASPAFLHFEVRRGVESTDPAAFLQ